MVLIISVLPLKSIGNPLLAQGGCTGVSLVFLLSVSNLSHARQALWLNVLLKAAQVMLLAQHIFSAG
jgi:hypothetical protein